MSKNTTEVRGWVSTGCGRTTNDILWSCLATVFLCVWIALHPPIAFTRWEKHHPILNKMALVIWDLLFPEFMVANAIYELAAARAAVICLRKMGVEDSTLMHGFFLNMRGFYVRSPQDEILNLRYQHIQRVSEGNLVQEVTDPSGSIDFRATKPSAQPQWLYLLRGISKYSMKTLAASDMPTTLIACTQVMWFVTQVVSRVFQDLAVTLLEVSTIAYVLCALVAYTAWWEKPQGCRSPIVFDCTHQEFLALSQVRDPDHDLFTNCKSANSYPWFDYLIEHGLDDFPLRKNKAGSIKYIWTITFLLFAALHLATWNISLPTRTELWAWRASTIYCASFPLMMSLHTWMFERPIDDSMEDILSFCIFVVVSVLMIVTRTYMIVEIFISLRVLPSSAYDSVHWSSFVPHI